MVAKKANGKISINIGLKNKKRLMIHAKKYGHTLSHIIRSLIEELIERE